MAAEEWARQIIETELGRTVVKNDDGSAPGMYDLRIGSSGEPQFAIECVGAIDPTFTETWNVGPAKGPLKIAITGDWNVEIAPTARVKRLKSHLEPVLQDLETQGIYTINVDFHLKWIRRALFDRFESVGITHASCYRRNGTGLVHLGMAGAGGAIDNNGTEVPEWIGYFLRHPAREDVLSKLKRSGAKEHHAFVIAELHGVPWPVESYLMGALDFVPIEPPDLPPPVTAVWIASTYGERGIRWDGESWRLFDAKRQRHL
jgi:hypothetical protein